MTNWYLYNQNNSGGSFVYDDKNGLSVNVYIEAENSDHANEIAEQVGIYFDGEYDCDCCGNRWYPASDWPSTVDHNEIPELDEPFIKDDNNESSAFKLKWMEEGKYEAFIHPLNKPFYGAHAEFKHIKRKTKGYGLGLYEDCISEIIPVGKDGWDKDGNFQAPSPDTFDRDYPSFSDNYRIKNFDNELIFATEPSYGFTLVWSKDKKTLKKIVDDFKPIYDKIKSHQSEISNKIDRYGSDV